MFNLIDWYLNEAEKGFRAIPILELYMVFLFVIGAVFFIIAVFPFVIIGMLARKKVKE